MNEGNEKMGLRVQVCSVQESWNTSRRIPGRLPCFLNAKACERLKTVRIAPHQPQYNFLENAHAFKNHQVIFDR
jgi:hypothetical protein